MDNQKQAKKEFIQRINDDTSKKFIESVAVKIIPIGEKLISELSKRFSNKQFEEKKSLSIKWNATYLFRAYAEEATYDRNQCTIYFSYGVTLNIYKQALLFTIMCDNFYKKEEFDIFFKEFDYGCGRDNIIPAAFDSYGFRAKFKKYAMEWLYLHEQAHLYQCHGLAFEMFANNKSEVFSSMWCDSVYDEAQKLSLDEEDSLLKHCFEFSADWEATGLLLIKSLINDNSKDNMVLDPNELWVAVLAITCLMHNFYGDTREYHKGVAFGTHPDPALRMRLILAQINDSLKNKDFKQYLQTDKTIEYYLKVIDHAYCTANLHIMQTMLIDVEDVPEFMKRVYDIDSTDNKLYFQKIKDKWLTVRPAIIENYFGYDSRLTLPDLSKRDLSNI